MVTALSDAYTLHYEIVSNQKGVWLRIWENIDLKDPRSKERLSPYLFRINFRMDTQQAALDFLQTYIGWLGQETIGGISVDTQRSVTIIPLPTQEVLSWSNPSLAPQESQDGYQIFHASEFYSDLNQDSASV